jgi:phage-related protein
MGSSKRDLCEFPEDVKDVMGLALLVAQFGGKHEAAKVLQALEVPPCSKSELA